MNEDDRAVRIAVYMLENDSTVRRAAKAFGVSKSTVHKDVSYRLRYTDKALYLRLRRLLDKNKSERHIRGGMATRLKYKACKETVDKT